jgi:hypothetical protein
MRSVQLRELTAAEVRAAFGRVGLPPPTSTDLIQALQNPFLFSLYARIASPETTALGSGGRVTGFRIVQEFWNLRVIAPSEGHRSTVATETESTLAKRRAISHLVCETLAGKSAARLPLEDEQAFRGFEMLKYEGVVVPQGSHAVRWRHDWFREYALVDSLVGRADRPSHLALASAICALDIDHVARTAAVGGAKWAIMDEAWGPVESYLDSLQKLQPGFASEALASLLEEPSSHLDLSKLNDKLLIEAIDLARKMKARQWLSQISSLPPARYASPSGPQLLDVTIRYESELM